MIEELIPLFLIRAIMASVITSITTAILGIYVVSRNLSSAGAALAHTALAGAVLGHLLGVDPYLGALSMNLVLSIVIANLSISSTRESEAVIGLLFGFSTALAVTLVSLVKEYVVVVWTYLIGDVLGVTLTDILFLASVSLITINVLMLCYKEFKFITFDIEGARAMGLNVTFYHFLMTVLIALVTTICLRTVGSILTTVLLVAPAATARKITHSFEKAIALSIIVSLLSSFMGMYVSLQLNLTVSGTIGLVASLLYFITGYIVAKFKYCKKCRLLIPQQRLSLKVKDRD